MFVDTTYRSKEIEIMDDLDMTGEMLVDALDKLAIINRWLGGNQLTLHGVKQLVQNKDKSAIIRIIDLGCGNGDMLRIIADYAHKKGFLLDLIGIDANLTTVEHARELSNNYENISYMQLDINSDMFKNLDYDIALSTLFMHHFDNQQIVELVTHWSNQAKIGVVINDLHRHKLAYYLFYMISTLFGNKMIKEDGLVSILKGFKKRELLNFAKQINIKSSIRWKWAFRYQWIIQKA